MASAQKAKSDRGGELGFVEAQGDSPRTLMHYEFDACCSKHRHDPVGIVGAEPCFWLFRTPDSVDAKVGFFSKFLSGPIQRSSRRPQLGSGGHNFTVWVFIDHFSTSGHKEPVWVIYTHARVGDTDTRENGSTMFQGFKIQSAKSLASTIDHVPSASGVYAALIENGRPLLEPHGYFELEFRPIVSLGRHQVLYLGATARGLNLRLAAHLFGDARRSTLRMTLGGLLSQTLGLQAHGKVGQNYYHFGRRGEARLTKWILEHLAFAYRETDRPHDEEVSLIGLAHPPLNITQQKAQPFAKQLMALRSDLSARWG